MKQARICVICGGDITGKRVDAHACGSSCRAEKTRLEHEGLPLPYPSGRPNPKRPRSRRAGVEIYLTDSEAECLAAANGSLQTVAEKAARALARRRAVR